MAKPNDNFTRPEVGISHDQEIKPWLDLRMKSVANSIKAKADLSPDEDEEKINSSESQSEDDTFSNISEHTDSESTITGSETMEDDPTETYNTSSTPVDTDEISMSDETEEDSEMDSTGEESAVHSDVDDTEETTDDDSYNSDDTDRTSDPSSETDRPSSESSDGDSTSSTPASQDSQYTDTDINDENRPIEIPDEYTVRAPKKDNIQAKGEDLTWSNDNVETDEQLDKIQQANAILNEIEPAAHKECVNEVFGTASDAIKSTNVYLKAHP